MKEVYRGWRLRGTQAMSLAWDGGSCQGISIGGHYVLSGAPGVWRLFFSSFFSLFPLFFCFIFDVVVPSRLVVFSCVSVTLIIRKVGPERRLGSTRDWWIDGFRTHVL